MNLTVLDEDIRLASMASKKKIITLIALVVLAVNKFSLNTLAMTNPVYSYTFKQGAINLFTAVASYGSECMNIASEINGIPVSYIDESFRMYEEANAPSNNITALRPILWYGGPLNLKSVNFPETIQSMPAGISEHFKKYYRQANVDINISENTSFFQSNVSSNGTLYYYECGYFIDRTPKVTVPDVSLTDICDKADVYVDGIKFDDCVFLNGVTYISYSQFRKTAGVEIWHPTAYQAAKYNPEKYDPKLMGFKYAVNKTPHFLNSESEYCDESNAEYIECFKRVIANSYTGELMIYEYYDDISKEARYRYARIPGGEIKITEIPIFPDYIPLRAVYEGLGFNVEWNGKTVRVTSPDAD